MTSPDREQYYRIQKALQAHILTDYPNPARLGCVSKEIIEQLVQDRGLALDADANYQHVIHCSPCYREFLELVEAGEREKRERQPLNRFRKLLGRLLRPVG